jgi:hypothetical protein
VQPKDGAIDQLLTIDHQVSFTYSGEHNNSADIYGW